MLPQPPAPPPLLRPAPCWLALAFAACCSCTDPATSTSTLNDAHAAASLFRPTRISQLLGLQGELVSDWPRRRAYILDAAGMVHQIDLSNLSNPTAVASSIKGGPPLKGIAVIPGSGLLCAVQRDGIAVSLLEPVEKTGLPGAQDFAVAITILREDRPELRLFSEGSTVVEKVLAATKEAGDVCFGITSDGTIGTFTPSTPWHKTASWPAAGGDLGANGDGPPSPADLLRSATTATSTGLPPTPLLLISSELHLRVYGVSRLDDWREVPFTFTPPSSSSSQLPPGNATGGSGNPSSTTTSTSTSASTSTSEKTSASASSGLAGGGGSSPPTPPRVPAGALTLLGLGPGHGGMSIMAWDGAELLLSRGGGGTLLGCPVVDPQGVSGGSSAGGCWTLGPNVTSGGEAIRSLAAFSSTYAELVELRRADPSLEGCAAALVERGGPPTPASLDVICPSSAPDPSTFSSFATMPHTSTATGGGDNHPNQPSGTGLSGVSNPAVKTPPTRQAFPATPGDPWEGLAPVGPGVLSAVCEGGSTSITSTPPAPPTSGTCFYTVGLAGHGGGEQTTPLPGTPTPGPSSVMPIPPDGSPHLALQSALSLPMSESFDKVLAVHPSGRVAYAAHSKGLAVIRLAGGEEGQGGGEGGALPGGSGVAPTPPAFIRDIDTRGSPAGSAMGVAEGGTLCTASLHGVHLFDVSLDEENPRYIGSASFADEVNSGVVPAGRSCWVFVSNTIIEVAPWMHGAASLPSAVLPRHDFHAFKSQIASSRTHLCASQGDRVVCYRHAPLPGGGGGGAASEGTPFARTRPSPTPLTLALEVDLGGHVLELEFDPSNPTRFIAVLFSDDTLRTRVTACRIPEGENGEGGDVSGLGICTTHNPPPSRDVHFRALAVVGDYAIFAEGLRATVYLVDMRELESVRAYERFSTNLPRGGYVAVAGCPASSRVLMITEAGVLHVYSVSQEGSTIAPHPPSINEGTPLPLPPIPASVTGLGPSDGDNGPPLPTLVPGRRSTSRDEGTPPQAKDKEMMIWLLGSAGAMVGLVLLLGGVWLVWRACKRRYGTSHADPPGVTPGRPGGKGGGVRPAEVQPGGGGGGGRSAKSCSGVDPADLGRVSLCSSWSSSGLSCGSRGLPFEGSEEVHVVVSPAAAAQDTTLNSSSSISSSAGLPFEDAGGVQAGGEAGGDCDGGYEMSLRNCCSSASSVSSSSSED